MKTLRLACLAIPLLLVPAGCGPGAKPLSERDLNEMKALQAESQYAMTMKQWSRAESLYERAIKISPEVEFFHNLGSARMRLQNRAGAKEAYESGIRACDHLAAVKRGSTDPLLKKIQLLALLGKVEEARALQAKIDKEFRQDHAVRAFVDGKKLDALIASPIFKEIAL
ncbi:MAG: hypothetical protein JNL39_12015 [Opitutaceae bacterium]|nr:hypothetical protein [Opitutaceae bacterium]